MNDSLQCLVNTKAALDLGLVSKEDYDGIKEAFLNAQKLRAAYDSGMLSQDQFDANKGEYLASLSMQDTPAAAPAGLVKSTTSTPRSSVPSPREPNGAVATAAVLKSQEPAFRPPRPPSAGQYSAPAVAEANVTSSGNPIPANLSKIPGSKPRKEGVSMSGINVTEDAVNLFYHIRSKSAYKWALWKLDDKGLSVIIGDVGEPGSTFQEFIDALPENDCRYGGEIKLLTYFIYLFSSLFRLTCSSMEHCILS